MKQPPDAQSPSGRHKTPDTRRSRPVIGITVDYTPSEEAKRTGGGKLCLNWNYAQAVADAGGIPLLIPPQAEPEEIMPLLDGILIPGGNDIDAKNWGEENHPKAETIAPQRFDAEKRLYECLDPGLPVLGICYGCQFLNVMHGGSIIQHIPDEPDKVVHTGGALQTYGIASGSKLSAVVEAPEMTGESWHHQAIKDLGDGLRIVATNEDDTVEAVEAEDRPWVIGVQWHPERSLDDAKNRKLFKEFVAAAAKYREARHARR